MLEDDIRFHNLEIISLVISNIPSWDIINLHITHGIFERTPVYIAPGIDAFRASISCFGAYAYLITRPCATFFGAPIAEDLQFC